MKKLAKTVSSILVAICVLLSGANLCWAENEVNVAMVLWRGMTKAEKGFQTGLLEATNGNTNFTVLDAGQDKKNLGVIIEGLEDGQYDLIYTFGTTVTKLIKAKIKKTPIVFCIVSRPVKAGIIDSWESSGSNVTGASNAVPMDSVFRTLAKVLKINKLGFLYNTKEANSVIQRDEIEKYQKEFGYTMVEGPVDSVASIPQVLKDLIAAKVDAVLLPSDSLVKASADEIIPPLNAAKVPTIVSIPGMVKENNAFLGLGPDYFELGKLAAVKAKKILDGAKPTNVPSSTLDRQHLTVNLKTSKQIGVSVPIQVLRISSVVK